MLQNTKCIFFWEVRMRHRSRLQVIFCLGSCAGVISLVGQLRSHLQSPEVILISAGITRRRLLGGCRLPGPVQEPKCCVFVFFFRSPPKEFSEEHQRCISEAQENPIIPVTGILASYFSTIASQFAQQRCDTNSVHTARFCRTSFH